MALNTILSHPEQNSYVTVAEANEYLAMKANYSEWAVLPIIQKEGFLKQAALQMEQLRYKGNKLYGIAKDYRKSQKLSFPRTNLEKLYYGNVSSSTANSVSILQLANQQYLADDVLNGGTVVIREGTGKGQTLTITDWDSATGTAFVSGWTIQPDTTSQVLFIENTNDNIKYAQIEQAYFLALRKDEDILGILSGLGSYRIDDLSENYNIDNVKFALVGGLPFSPYANQLLQGIIDTTGYITY